MITDLIFTNNIEESKTNLEQVIKNFKFNNELLDWIIIRNSTQDKYFEAEQVLQGLLMYLFKDINVKKGDAVSKLFINILEHYKHSDKSLKEVLEYYKNNLLKE